METWELSAREQIRELVATYAHCADSGRFAELVALFADDGILETPDGQQHRGQGAIREFLGATKTRLANATQASLIRHNVSNLHITVSGPSEANGAAYFLVITERGLDHWGRYRDRYACHDGQWRFAHRRVRLEGRSPNSAFAPETPSEPR
jgi:ketosteroid isomerase-like protein